jgi:hypothetical protein
VKGFNIRIESGSGAVVLVDESAEPVSALDWAGSGLGWRVGRLQGEAAMERRGGFADGTAKKESFVRIESREGFA